eukprot:3941432-Rhodomonas_salina.10
MPARLPTGTGRPDIASVFVIMIVIRCPPRRLEPEPERLGVRVGVRLAPLPPHVAERPATPTVLATLADRQQSSDARSSSLTESEPLIEVVASKGLPSCHPPYMVHTPCSPPTCP